ncbi:DUF4352 domain-containing protein [Peristeroidobacter agariperforans]|uniref:hypothetical protein n=1 Tax=Peristeroidobacter agariperforans TaxID=268404 RepID=UPI00101D837F|nr:hypothetical protein [Peristeroidobacter agariperforans]
MSGGAHLAAKVAGMLLSIGAILFMWHTMPGYVEITAPFVTRGDAGEWVHTRTFGVRVDKSYLSRTLRQTSFGRSEERTTSGVWVIVKVDALAVHEPSMIGAFALQTEDGRRYQHTERVRLSRKVGLLGRELQPEMPVAALLVFEVPEDVVANLMLIAGEREIPHLTSEAHISLRWQSSNPLTSIRDTLDLGS